MPQQSYAIEKDGPKRLTLSWKAGWREIAVVFDGQAVGTIPNQKALSVGQEMALPDGSKLFVKLARNFIATELQVLRNGQPVPGSMSDPQARVKVAYQIAYFIAGFNLVLGLLATLFQIEFLQAIGVGVYSIFFGLVFLALGFFIQRKSNLALILAIIIFALDGIVGFVSLAMASGRTNIGGLFVRILLLIPLVQGVSAIRTLKKEEAESVIRPA